MKPIAFKDLDDKLQAMIATPTAIVNHADGEDLTVRKEVLKFADRHYDTFGKVYTGYVVVRRKYGDALVNEVIEEDCILTQDMINEPNTIYEIRYDFNLRGNDIVMPEGCAIVFNGGRIHNGHVKLNNTLIHSLDKYWADLIYPSEDSVFARGQLRFKGTTFEYFNGDEWFDPFVTLRQALIENVENINDSIAETNKTIAEGFANFALADENERKDRINTDNKLEDLIKEEIKHRIQDVEILNNSIDTVVENHNKDIAKLDNRIKDNKTSIEETKLYTSDMFQVAFDLIKSDKDELTKFIVESVLKEHNDRVKVVAREVQRIFEYIENREEVFNTVLKGYRTDIDNATRHVDTISDRVNQALVDYEKIIHDQQMTIINNQNRIDVLRDRILELENNNNKYHVRFVIANTKEVINSQYVKAGYPAIAPPVPEGSKFDKSFAAIYEDTVINVTV